MISTFIFGSFSLASTVARAGVWPGTTQASHTAFMAAKSPMSRSQITADRIFVFVAAALLRQRIDLGQRLLHLAGDVERGVLGDHAREIHAIAEDAGLAHARAGVDANNATHAAGLRSMAMMWIGVWPTMG